jgi:hypothetical protein
MAKVERPAHDSDRWAEFLEPGEEVERCLRDDVLRSRTSFIPLDG